MAGAVSGVPQTQTTYMYQPVHTIAGWQYKVVPVQTALPQAPPAFPSAVGTMPGAPSVSLAMGAPPVSAGFLMAPPPTYMQPQAPTGSGLFSTMVPQGTGGVTPPGPTQVPPLQMVQGVPSGGAGSQTPTVLPSQMPHLLVQQQKGAEKDTNSTPQLTSLASAPETLQQMPVSQPFAAFSVSGTQPIPQQLVAATYQGHPLGAPAPVLQQGQGAPVMGAVAGVVETGTEPPISPAGSVDQAVARNLSGTLHNHEAARSSFRPRASTAPSTNALSFSNAEALAGQITGSTTAPDGTLGQAPGMTVHWIRIHGSDQEYPVVFLQPDVGLGTPQGPVPNAQILGSTSLSAATVSQISPSMMSTDAAGWPSSMAVPPAPTAIPTSAAVTTDLPPIATPTAATAAAATAAPAASAAAAPAADAGSIVQASGAAAPEASPISLAPSDPSSIPEEGATPISLPESKTSEGAALPSFGQPSLRSHAPSPSTVSVSGRDSVVIAMYYLPVTISLDADDRLVVDWDDEALHVARQSHRLDQDDFPQIYFAGTPRLPPSMAARDLTVTEKKQLEMLLDRYDCTPVFVDPETAYHFYEGFCKDTLWPALHNVVDVYGRYPTRWWNRAKQEARWLAYMKVNNMFSLAITRRWSEGCIIWIHDYHLLLTPQTLARRFPTTFIGLYLHTPFPSSEVRTLHCNLCLFDVYWLNPDLRCERVPPPANPALTCRCSARCHFGSPFCCPCCA